MDDEHHNLTAYWVSGIVVVLAIILGAWLLASPNNASACGFWSSCANESASAQQQNEQDSVTQTVSKLSAQTPVPALENSLERQNISKRLVQWSDPNKISYIYLVSYGRVMAYYVVKGKVTSGNKRMTSTQRMVDSQNCGGSSNCSMMVEAPELDGTYGSSNSYIFFWTTDGTYVQWSGDYMLTDQPMQLSTQPDLVRNVK